MYNVQHNVPKHKPRDVKQIWQPKTKTKLTSKKCVTNSQQNTPYKNCSYDNANIAEKLYFRSSD